jgi:hypothetical protein
MPRIVGLYHRDLFRGVGTPRASRCMPLPRRRPGRPGLAGILFDNEPYAERLWRWPDEVDYPYTLAAYQLQYRLRGRELMEALRAA